MFGAFFLVSEQFVGERLVFRRCLARQRVPAIGRMVTLPSRARTRISGEEQTIWKPPKSR